MELIDSYRTFCPKASENTFFPSAHGNLSKVDYILGHKSSLSKFQVVEIISIFFFQIQCYKIRNQLPRKPVNSTNTWKLNSMLLNNQSITEEIKEEIKKNTYRQMTMKT